MKRWGRSGGRRRERKKRGEARIDFDRREEGRREEEKEEKERERQQMYPTYIRRQARR